MKSICLKNLIMKKIYKPEDTNSISLYFPIYLSLFFLSIIFIVVFSITTSKN